MNEQDPQKVETIVNLQQNKNQVEWILKFIRTLCKVDIDEFITAVHQIGKVFSKNQGKELTRFKKELSDVKDFE